MRSVANWGALWANLFLQWEDRVGFSSLAERFRMDASFVAEGGNM